MTTTSTTTRHPADDDNGHDAEAAVASTAGKDRDVMVRDLVPSWLRSANLGYATANFEMAGILTPRSFAELELRYFEPLGVTDGDDRKRLFYLIQRVREELRREEEDGEEVAAAVVAKTRTTTSAAKASGERGGRRKDGGRTDDGDDNDDGYDEEKFRSPSKNSNFDLGDRGELSSTVVTTKALIRDGGNIGVSVDAMEVISPVTLSSPIASSSVSDGNRHHRHYNHHVGDDDDDGGIVITSSIESSSSKVGRRLGHCNIDHGSGIKGAGGSTVTGEASSSGGVTSHQSAAMGRGGRNKITAREQLQRELELRAERRREMKKLMNNDNNNADGSRSLGSRRRRQSFLPSISNPVHADTQRGRSGTEETTTSGIRPSSSRPSSTIIATSSHHRPLASAAMATMAHAGNSAIERRAVAMTTKGRNRALPGGNDAESAMSDTSDLSASVFSNDRSSSLGVASRSSSVGGGSSRRRRSSIPSASFIGPAAASHRPSSSSSYLSGRISGNITAHVSAASGHTDENKNYVNFDEKKTGTVATTKNGSALILDGKKRLSTIPASAIDPLSPLKGFSSTLHNQSLATATFSIGSNNPLRRGSRSSLGGDSESGSVGGCGSRGVPPPSSSRPGSAATSESMRERQANSTSNGDCVGIEIPPRTTTIAGSSGRLLRPSSRSSMVGSQRFDVYDRLKASLSPSGNKPVVSESTMSVQLQRQHLESPVPPMSSHGCIAGGGGSSVQSQQLRQRISPHPPRGRERATSPTRSISSARSNRPVSPKSTTHHQHSSQSPPKMGVINGNNNGGQLSPTRSKTRSKTPPPAVIAGSTKGISNATTKGAVFVHGALDDTSWATQIGRLRESFEHEHAQYLTSTVRQLRQQQSCEDDVGYDMRIRVIVRKRPMSIRESSEDVDAVQTLDYDDYGRILVHQPKTKLDLTKEVESTSFAFDNVFDEKSNNENIYERSVRGLIPGLFRGTWASVFAYGQTGSGKTFTMMGANSTGKRAGNHAENSVNRANLGLYCLAAQDVFRIAEEPACANISIGVSLFEIYGGKLLDLLNARNSVRCLEDSHGKVCFPGLSERTMLQFLQHEMTLVNDTDTNRDNIDEYLNELEHLSDQQLILLSTLREKLNSSSALQKVFSELASSSVS
ncbi:hypothetical protein ACHAXA_005827 [Cyclostephanos tholiformis]|uniref:Kinesin n=1 Tax=Cyclostephanos tholiformis TaxID=382380 RepID=A0ABD3RZY0_9STRA